MTAPPTKSCQNCGAQMDAAAEVCPKCGFRVVATPQPSVSQTAVQQKNPIIAAVASVVLPGLGQIYTEETRKGIALVIIAVFFLYLAVAFHNIVAELGDTLYVVLLLYTAYDAYNTAKTINAGLT